MSKFNEGDSVKCIKAQRSTRPGFSQLYVHDEYRVDEVSANGSGYSLHLVGEVGWFDDGDFELVGNEESIPIQVPCSGEQTLKGLCPGGSYIIDCDDTYFPFMVRGKGLPDNVMWQVMAPGGTEVLAEYEDSKVACTVALLLSQGQG